MRLRVRFVLDKFECRFRFIKCQYCFIKGESTCGQRALYEIGMTGIPIYNCNNNCSTGATALMLAKQLVETGNNDCVLAVGFEKMQPGSLSTTVSKPCFLSPKHSPMKRILFYSSIPIERYQPAHTLKSWRNHFKLPMGQ